MGEKDESEELLKSIEEMMEEEGAAEQELQDFDEDLAQNTPEETIEILEGQRDEYRDKFMRALADAENTRKRAEKDRRDAEKYGGSRLARDLLPVYDNLHRALNSSTDEQKAANEALFEGVELTLKSLMDTFEKHGLEIIKPEVGDKFDPQNHQAMFEAPVPGTKKDEIIQVAADGFILHDRLIRPAQVGVSSNTEK